MRLLSRAVIALAALLPLAAPAADAPNEEGKQYKLVMHPAPGPANAHVVVEEFFWYGCPHCYAFEPLLNDWLAKKPADVDFVRVPNTLGRAEGLLHSKLYYALEELNLLPKLHGAVFQAIHDERRPMSTEADLQAFVTDKGGVMPDVFSAAFNGNSVDAKVRRAESLARTYGVASTPTLVVDGRWMLNATMA
ncbi:MAG TPA: thiol:disulfide interchange protein DsbA/DsbL, partial [Nevskiaceae bacterium]|nr:thiol:disulfide interchange protein DsbA/DsbL [Nevskiaceae bacterium]